MQANHIAIAARVAIASLMLEIIRNTPTRHTDTEVVALVETLSRAHAAMWIINVP